MAAKACSQEQASGMLHAHSIHGLTLRAGHVWPVWCAAATCGGAAHFPALLPGRLPKVLALTIHYLRVLHTLVCDGLPSQGRLSEHIIFVWILIGQMPKESIFKRHRAIPYIPLQTSTPGGLQKSGTKSARKRFDPSNPSNMSGW